MADSNFVCLKDFENHAKKVLPRSAIDYYQSGAHEEITLRENMKAFNRFLFLPRMLQTVSHRSLKTTILGQEIEMPIAISPTAMQRMAHPDGEVATARAAARAGTCMILSTIATSSVEEVAEGVSKLQLNGRPQPPRWLQLYIYKDRSVSEGLVRRAEEAGYTALVLTVDTPLFGQRWADNRNRFTMPPHLRMANFTTRGAAEDRANRSESESGLNEYALSLFDPTLTWNDVTWLCSFTRLPVVVKGVLTPEDALLAVRSGARAVMVSNHGARQLDTVPASIEALPGIVSAVPSTCEVYLDGGVRTGGDILKALALGARAVFVGRPALWGLAHSGEDGVLQILEILKKEIDVSMALLGIRDVKNVDKSLVMHQSKYRALL